MHYRFCLLLTGSGRSLIDCACKLYASAMIPRSVVLCREKMRWYNDSDMHNALLDASEENLPEEART